MSAIALVHSDPTVEPRLKDAERAETQLSPLGLAALEYAVELGWAVFPLKPRGKQPASNAGAIPGCEGGFYRASSHPEQIAEWWDEIPEANIGLWPGASGLLVIDADGPEGARAAEALGLIESASMVVETGRGDGGLHLYFARPAFPVSNRKLAPKLDTRCDGGYVVLPPSVHPDTGTEYRWVR